MKSYLVGVIFLICAAGFVVEAFAQERPKRTRNQSLEEQTRTYNVFTTQSVPTAESPKRHEANDGTSNLKKTPRPKIIEGPGYNKGISAPPR